MAALWRRDDPGFVLGSMLPDLTTMAGVRLREAGPAAVAAGVEFHHRTDAAFHRTAGFVELCAEARDAMRASGVERGVAMAAAHVGIELLLDGVWLDDPRVDDAYLRAIAHTETLPSDALRWRQPEHGSRFWVLCERMRAWGSPVAYRDPEEVGRRLVRILSRRPRLTPGPEDEPRLCSWARVARARVREAAPEIQQQLRDGLE